MPYWKFAYSNLFRNAPSDPPVRDQLSSFLEIFISPNKPKETLIERVAILLENNERVDIQNKREWLSTGILNTLTDISTFLDLRPNLDSKRTKVREILPIVVLELKYTDSADNENSTIIQLTEKDISILENAIEDVRKKISLIKSNQAISPLIATEGT